MSDITPSVLSNAILGKLYDVLTNGDDTVPKSTEKFITFQTPGTPVTEKSFQYLTQGFTGVVKPEAVQTLLQATNAGAQAPGTAGSAAAPSQGLTDAQLSQLRAQDVSGLYQQAEAFARLVDFVPDLSSINGQQFAQLAIQSNNGSLSDVYKMTLTMCQVMESVISDEEKAKIAHLRSLLTCTTKTKDLISGAEVEVTGASPLVKAYHDKMTAFDNAALAYNNARISALAANDPQSVAYFAINGPILRNQVTEAMADWVTTGYKNQYEEIAAYIAQVEGRDMSLLLASYKDDLEKAKLTGIVSGSDFYYTGVTPADFYESAGWSHFHFASGDFARYANSSFNSNGWNAHASAANLGFGASGGASGSSSTSQYNSSFNSDHCSMSFEIAQVGLVFPWLRLSWLDQTTWRWDPGNPDLKNNLLSDGGSPPKGLLPAYPTAMFVIRNLALDFGDNRGVQNYMTEQSAKSQSGSAAFSFGPFSIGGGGGHSSSSGSTTSSSSYSWTDQGLSVPGMQIMGYCCKVRRKITPNPSADIKAWI